VENIQKNLGVCESEILFPTGNKETKIQKAIQQTTMKYKLKILG